MEPGGLSAVLGAADDQVDGLLFAAYNAWRSNGHDVLTALLHVHRHHVDPATATLAAQAYDWLLDAGVKWRQQALWRAFDTEFGDRLRTEQ